MIPAFPEFTPITLDHKHELDAYFKRNPPVTSELNFTNLFMWQEVHDYQIARFGSGFFISAVYDGALCLLQPLVEDDMDTAVQEAFKYLQENIEKPTLRRVGEDFMKAGFLDAADVSIDEDRNNFDYVYSAQELIELPTQKYHDKKNLIRQFTKKSPYVYTRCSSIMIEKAKQFIDQWCTVKQCDIHEGLGKENRAVKKLLDNLDVLDVVGAAIEVDGRIVALSFGEKLNNDTFVVHIEKARADMIGLYQTINWEFLRNEAQHVSFVNREQDVGVEGLRKAKLSYNPIGFVKKYTVCEKDRC
ncbi:DUF2156 domain-containing protein [Candidatus Omnitrophota bacterium]